VRAGIDIGGTFTDLVADVDGRLQIVKVPSTPDPADGFVDALGRVASPDEVLHGTTVATNAVIERRGARLALVATEGFRHMLHLGRQDRPSLYDLRAVRPQPLVGRDMCIGAPERVGPDGAVLRDLDEDALRASLRTMQRTDAVAIVLLHAYANPVHERRVASIVREELGDVAVSVSSDVLPEFREYERASTTAMNAYVQPVVARYLARLQTAAGGARVAVMRSGGGLRGIAASIRHPVHTLLSGPAAGVIGAAWVARAAGAPDVVTLDMGGTSADVSLVDGGEPLVAESSSLGGLPFRTPCLDIVSVGAGGGSITWVDEGGALRVGPRSAGATPGPASYGRGGTEPTVTDAHVARGVLTELAGGVVRLDRDAAERAIASLPVDDAATGVLRVVNATMTRAIRSVSIERGKDVRRYALVAFGGAGPLHATSVAEELGIPRVLVPPGPGALAALGLLVSPRRADVSLSQPMPADNARVPDVLATLAQEASDELRAEGVQTPDVRRWVDCRYVGQSHELRIDASDPSAVASSFHAAHAERYGFSRPEWDVQIVTLRAAATGPIDAPELPSPPDGPPPDPMDVREVDGARVAVFARGALPLGARLKGPAIVSELDATTWVAPGWTAEVSPAALVLTP
jgi:N-methylhydantoinase A